MEFDATSPIWLQLVTEFSRRIAAGEWALDARIPGVRDLAAELAVNPNTVQRALAELERDGLCRSERTTGRFVTDDPDRVARLRHDLVAQAASDFAARAHGLGMTRGDAIALINERWNAHDDHAGTNTFDGRK